MIELHNTRRRRRRRRCWAEIDCHFTVGTLSRFSRDKKSVSKLFAPMNNSMVEFRVAALARWTTKIPPGLGASRRRRREKKKVDPALLLPVAISIEPYAENEWLAKGKMYKKKDSLAPDKSTRAEAMKDNVTTLNDPAGMAEEEEGLSYHHEVHISFCCGDWTGQRHKSRSSTTE